MTAKRFERIYEDVDVFCRDNNARTCQLIGREDYDKIVNLLNELHEENRSLKFQLDECQNHKLFSRRELEKENEQLKSDYETLQLQDNDRKQYQRELEKENEELKTQLDYAENLITTHLPVYYQKKWWNFKMGHKEYNDFWEEKLKKHKERLE